MEMIRFETPLLKSNMYILIEGRNAIVIDPYWNVEVDALIKNKVDVVDKVYLTHEHYDHISGVNDFKMRFNCEVLASESCARRLGDTRANFSRYFDAFAAMQVGEVGKVPRVGLYTCKADSVFCEYMVMVWQEHTIELYETPGHSPGSCCIYVDSENLFTGDTLIATGMPVTRFPDGDQNKFDEVTLPWLRKLPENTRIYPGHYHSLFLGSHDIIKNGGKKDDKFRKV